MLKDLTNRLKIFKVIGRTIPLSLAPLATQIVVVACGLVNFDGKFFVSNLSIPMLLCKEYTYLKLFRATFRAKICPQLAFRWFKRSIFFPIFLANDLDLSLLASAHECSDVFGNKH